MTSPTDQITKTLTMPRHIWDRVESHARARGMAFDAALVELITIGFVDSPAYRREGAR